MYTINGSVGRRVSTIKYTCNGIMVLQTLDSEQKSNYLALFNHQTFSNDLTPYPVRLSRVHYGERLVLPTLWV